MMSKITAYLHLLTVEVLQPHTIFLYRKAVYLYLLIFTCLQLPISHSLWSSDAVLVPFNYEGNIFLQSLNLLSHPNLSNFYLLLALLLLAVLLISFFVKAQRLLSFLIFFLYSNLYYRTIAIQNGGGDLLHLQLFYLFLMDENSSSMHSGKKKTMAVALTNYAFIASQVQVCIVYFVSSYYKLQGTQWMDGSALHYVFLNDEYSLGFLKNSVTSVDSILKIMTWFVLAFQLLFPLLIWIKKFKPLLLFAGIILHFFIAFGMGIVDFGILMLVMYLLFVNEAWSLSWRNKIFKINENY